MHHRLVLHLVMTIFKRERESKDNKGKNCSLSLGISLSNDDILERASKDDKGKNHALRPRPSPNNGDILERESEQRRRKESCTTATSFT